MLRNKEIIILLVLLLGTMAFVLWYVIDRRAKMHAAPISVPTGSAGPLAPNPKKPVDLKKHDGQTVDFSSGQPVVKNTPEDQAAINAALKEIAEANKDVTFEAPKKKP